MAAVIGNRNISLGVMGGTLITAACYGGGEVFGCSPYDAATTAYLKATYPSYWQAIRDYGFANPQLVPWINEDNDLIVSLVEVGKERWCVGDGAAHLNILDIPVRAYDPIYVKVKSMESGGTYYGLLGMGSSISIALWLNGSGSIETLGSETSTSGISYGNTYEFEKTDKAWYRNGTKVAEKSFNDSELTQITMFAFNLGHARPSHSKVTRFWFGENGSKANFVPCKNPNGSDYGMLDLVNLQWYGNAKTSGAFTIELTDTPT